VGELLEWEKGLVAAIERTEAEDPEFHAGDHCRCCPAKAICPTIKAKVYEVAKAEFEDDVIQLPVPEEMTPKDLQIVLENSTIIDSWIKQVQEHALKVMEDGGEVPGFKLVRKRTLRKWVNTDMVEKALSEQFGDKIFAVRKILSPAQMEKLVGKQSMAFIEDLWEKSEGGTTMAPEADKRLAVTADPQRKALEDFST